jgi:hypothetical protein
MFGKLFHSTKNAEMNKFFGGNRPASPRNGEERSWTIVLYFLQTKRK